MDSHLLFNWAVRASLLLAVAWPVVKLMERRSATVAHRLLAVLFLCMLIVLPVTMATAPGWRWTVPLWKVATTADSRVDDNAPPRPIASAFDLRDAENARPFPASHGIERMQSDRVGDDVSKAAAPSTESVTQVAPAGGPAESPDPAIAAPARTGELTGRRYGLTWPRIAWVMWLAIAGLLVIRFARSVGQLRRVVSGTEAASPRIANQVQSLSRRCGLKRSVRVLLSKYGAMPMACWVGRWVIIVPKELESWSEELQEITLLHELGHVARRDVWVDYLAQGVLCILWPNPLAWLAAADTRRLRERACDEWSLARYGKDAKTYALSLLEVVRRCQRQELQAACAIADKRGLESRLKWLFSCPMTRRCRVLVSVPTALTALGLAIVIATAQPTEGSRHDDQPASPELAPVAKSQEPSPAIPAVSVRGTVQDQAGNPIAGASVVLRANVGGIQYAMGLQHARDVLARTRTDSLGRYEFSGIGLPPRFVDAIDKLRTGKPGAQVLAWADTAGLQWKPVSSFKEANVDFRLESQADVAGVASDAEGEPLEDAVLTVVGFTKATNNVDSFLNDPGDLNLIHSEVQFTATTGNGRFSLAKMPRDYRVAVRLESHSGHRTFFVIDTGTGAFNEIDYRNAGRESVPVHRTPIRVTADQQPFVRISVVDAQGNPVSGGGVEAIDSRRHYGGSAAVDSDGTALLVVNRPGLHEVYYASDPLSPMIGVVQQVNIQPEGNDPVVMQLPASRVLRGRVVDSDTGAPVPGVYVSGNSTNADQTQLPGTGSMAVSGTDGHFELPVTKGVCKLSIRHEVDGYFVPTYAARRSAGPDPVYPTVTITDEEPIDEVVVKVARGLVVKGTVVDEQGLPVRGIQVTATTQGGSYRQTATVTDTDGAYRFAGLSPYVPTRIAAWSESGAAEETIGSTEDHPWQKTLTKNVALKLISATSVVGRVTQAGRPVSGVSVRLFRAGPADPGEQGVRFSLSGKTVTDAQGKYRLAGLTKGDRYYLDVEPLGGAEVRDWRYAMPYSHTVEVEDGETIELPDAELKPHGQTLSGVVVDPDGNAVEGITVSASLASGTPLSRPQKGPPPWTETDDQGRFELSHLPDEPISLMAFKANPSGGRILHASHASPEMNANDIRIVFDPSLFEEPEDLD